MTGSLLTLFCVVDGEAVPFSVKVAPTDSVDDLKKAIKAQKTIDFSDVDADKLTLWLGSIPIPPPKEQKPIFLDEAESPTELGPSDDISDVFVETPPKKTIHIIVQRPPPATTKRSGEWEPETARKFPKIFGATSISETRMFETTDDAGHSQQVLELPRDLPNFFSWRTITGTIFADKTPYIKELEKGATNYRYVFLRPRRFGKSAFLDMLCSYYDVHNANIFDDLFGPLYIGKHPTTSKNKHLVLKLDLSSISVYGTLEAMTTSFNDYINDELRAFLAKYYQELSSPEENDIISDSATRSLRRILKLIAENGQSIFIGVGEYDAPANSSAFAGGNIEFGKDVLDNGCSIRSTNEYGVVISKYFLTGVTPAFRAGFSPLTAVAIISNKPSLQGICGFSETEVAAVVKHYLRMNDQEADPLLHSIRRLYNGYCFALTDDEESSSPLPLVYNPHLVFHYLSNFQSEGFVAKPEESTAVHSTRILKSIADVGEFSVNDLVDLIVSKSVQSKIITEFGYSELLSVGKDREITWSLLFYLGILTLGPNGSLRVPNDIIKSEVLARIATFLRAQDKISALMVPAIRSLKAGNAEEFRKLLETFFSYRAVRSLKNANEAVLQGIVELLLDEPSNRVPELRLVVDGSKEPGNGRFGFVDIFIPRQAMAAMSEQT
ncbi:hypothetical protein BG004_008328, partial [Podila humilis]